jgi:hypothetical protein
LPVTLSGAACNLHKSEVVHSRKYKNSANGRHSVSFKSRLGMMNLIFRHSPVMFLPIVQHEGLYMSTPTYYVPTGLAVADILLH